VLTSIKNPKVAKAARLKKRAFRNEDRCFLVEGAQGVREALALPGGLSILYVTDASNEFAVRARQSGVEVIHIGDDLMRKLTSTVTPQGVLGVAPYRDVGLGETAGADSAVILHEVRDPGNAGTVLRSADAAGAGAVVFTEASVDPYNPKTVRASAGSLFHLPVVRGAPVSDAIDRVRSAGARVLSLDARGTESLFATDLAGPVAFVFGNEAHGLPQDVVARTDATVRVPHRGRAESLNLAAAATVCLFEWARRRVGRGEALEAIIAAAAHDIRSPLTAIKGFGYALEKRWDSMNDEQRSLMLRGVAYDADRMDQIVRLLVDAARIAAGALETFPDQTNVEDVVASVAEAQARDPDHPPIEWRGDPGPYFLDATRLKTAILAFVEALAWWADDGPITIEARRDGGRFHLSLMRRGSQIDAAAAAELFKPRRPGSGQGSKIGLFVARGLAEAQGGRAWSDVRGEKLFFHLELPVA
jgi:RNA methyltransferase, TrmH family